MTETRVAPLRIVLVDDSELVRRGIKTVLLAETSPRMEVVGEAGTATQAVSECLRLKPDIVLLDIRLPDGSGIDACRKIVDQLPNTRVVMLTSYSNDSFIYEAVSAGALGYLMKEIDPTGLVHALHDIAAGRSILDPDATSRVLRLLRTKGNGELGSDLSTLSHQERRVLAQVADGLTNKQVGEQLGLSENTVKNYLMNVFDKLKVKRRAQAAALYVQQSNPKGD